MGKNSAIEWTDHTFNPWWGCVKVSLGCEHCYAETIANRYGYSIWGPAKTTTRRLFGEKHWSEPLKWNAEAQKLGQRKRVFCASMADVFEDHPMLDSQRDRLWQLIEATESLDWLLLTKRPENIQHMLPSRWQLPTAPDFSPPMRRNVWLGVSAENQEEFERRWCTLQGEAHYLFPTVLFLSLEPLLSPINIEIAFDEDNIGDEDAPYYTRPVDWVIVGGESGPGARPMNPDWVRSIRDQCLAADIPFFFKQWGGPRKFETGNILDDKVWAQFPETT